MCCVFITDNRFVVCNNTSMCNAGNKVCSVFVHGRQQGW